jgi:hypothetical protein
VCLFEIFVSINAVSSQKFHAIFSIDFNGIFMSFNEAVILVSIDFSCGAKFGIKV